MVSLSPEFIDQILSDHSCRVISYNLSKRILYVTQYKLCSDSINLQDIESQEAAFGRFVIDVLPISYGVPVVTEPDRTSY